jgi:hypothetical protein
MINTAVPMIATPIIDILFTVGSIIFDIIMSLCWQVVAVLGLGGGGITCGTIISSIVSYITNTGLGAVLNNIIGGIAGLI